MKRIPSVNLFLLLAILYQLPTFGQSFSLLKNINPDGTALQDLFPVNANGTIYFETNDGVHGIELWKSDGTTAGTVMVKDINPGVDDGVNGTIITMNGIVYFVGNDGTHGLELWKSDGTDAGTVMVKDILPGVNKSGIRIGGGLGTAINASGTLYFAADDGSTGLELWKSDGTEAGTVLVKDINPGINTTGINAGKPKLSGPGNFKVLNNNIIVFTAITDDTGTELWKTDGTTAGTSLIKDLTPGAFPSSAIRNMIVVNGELFFTAHANDFQLWKSDGTAAGTVAVFDMNPIGLTDTWPVSLNNTLYFLDEDGLYKSDGTTIGTFKIKDASQTPKNLLAVGNTLFFIGANNTYGMELWKSDGTTPGTGMVKDINMGSDGSVFSGCTRVGNKLIFSVSDGFHGYEPWISDGTESGTVQLPDLDPDNSEILQIIDAGDKAYAVINTTTYGREVWVATVPNSILLPLTFLEFKGTLVNDDSQLQWKTDHEASTYSFLIERSVDGSKYTQVGYVNAANSDGIHTYAFKDPAVSSLGVSRVYYRLKEVDINGKYIYSRVVMLSIDSKSNFITIYPNPVQKDINLSLTLISKSRLNWQLVDYSGRIIKNGIYDLSAGSTSVSIEAGNLRPGTYLLQIKGDGVQQVLKVIKQ
jgi:ELWxxDGT repeat protein